MTSRMIRRTVPLALLVLALASGCTRKVESTNSAAAGRSEYVEASEQRLAEFDARLDTLRAQIGRADDATRVEMQKGIDQLETARHDARRKLDEVRVASERTWQKAKVELADLLDALDRRFDEARARLRS